MSGSTDSLISVYSTNDQLFTSLESESAEAKYRLMTEGEASPMLSEAQKFLTVGILDRFIGIFSSEQRAINAAKDLLAKPTQDISQAVSVFGYDNFIQNINTFITTLNQKIHNDSSDSDDFFVCEIPEAIPLINKSNYQQFLSDVQNDNFVRMLPDQQLDERTIQTSIKYVKNLVQEKTNLENLQTNTLQKWDRALMLMEAKTTDTLFKAVVTQAAHNLKNHEHLKNAPITQLFIDEHAATIWAKSSHQAFLSTVAKEFKAAVANISSSTDHTALKNVSRKINGRAMKIAEVLNEDADKIRKQLLDKLNEVPGFQADFQKAQGQLIQIVNDHRDLKKISAPQIQKITHAIQQFMGTKKAPESRNQETLLMAITCQSTTIIQNIKQEIDLLQQGNINVIKEAEEKAQEACDKLNLMHQLVGPQNSQKLSLEPHPPLPTNQQEALHHIAQELADDFLSIMDTLADPTKPSATLLHEVMNSLNVHQILCNSGQGDKQVSLLDLILGTDALHLDNIFEKESFSYGNVQFYKFKTYAASEPLQGIDALRKRISDQQLRQDVNKNWHVIEEKHPNIIYPASQPSTFVSSSGQTGHSSSTLKAQQPFPLPKEAKNQAWIAFMTQQGTQQQNLVPSANGSGNDQHSA